MIKAVTKELKSLALIDRLKWLMKVESCYSKIAKLLNKDSLPLAPNLCLWNLAWRVVAGSRTPFALWWQNHRWVTVLQHHRSFLNSCPQWDPDESPSCLFMGNIQVSLVQVWASNTKFLESACQGSQVLWPKNKAHSWSWGLPANRLFATGIMKTDTEVGRKIILHPNRWLFPQKTDEFRTP